MSNITLTTTQLAQIKEDMMVTTEMLSEAEVEALAHSANERVNLPFIGEEKEFIVLVKIIRFIDQKLYSLLPNEYYKLVKDSTDGISEEEAQRINDRLTPLINNLVNIPILTENHEAKIISFVLDKIIKAMVKGVRLEERS